MRRSSQHRGESRPEWDLATPAQRGSARASSHRWRGWILTFSGLVLAGLVAFLLYPILDGWTQPPHAAREAAVAAVTEARERGAAQWAADELLAAEEILRSALVDERHEEARLLFRRDFRPLAERFWAARERARGATRLALQRREEIRAQVDEALQVCRETLSLAEIVAAEMPFPRAQRMLLERARLRAAEAAQLLAAESYDGARSAAQEALQSAESACREALPLAARFVDPQQVGHWRQWVDETIAWSKRTRRPAMVVLKEKNRLDLYKGGRRVRSYDADVGRNRLRVKQRAGDAATPEGHYEVIVKKGRGESLYHMALLLDYPNADDRARFEADRRAGRITANTELGEHIEIHGEGGRGEDWTLGCVALANEDMEDLFARVEVGSRVTIVGGDGHDGTFSNLMRSRAAAFFRETSR